MGRLDIFSFQLLVGENFQCTLCDIQRSLFNTVVWCLSWMHEQYALYSVHHYGVWWRLTPKHLLLRRDRHIFLLLGREISGNHENIFVAIWWRKDNNNCIFPRAHMNDRKQTDSNHTNVNNNKQICILKALSHSQTLTHCSSTRHSLILCLCLSSPLSPHTHLSVKGWKAGM